MLSKPRPETIAARPIREWARQLGLPAGTTGPIRASIHTAYQAALAGASDAEARRIYAQAEAERLARNDQVKKGKWRGQAERDRHAELAPIRAWAKANGIALPANNLIPQAVLDAWTAAQAGQTTKRRPSKRPPKAAP